VNENETENSGEAAPAGTSGLPTFAETKLLAEWKYSSPLIACRFDPTGKYLLTAAQDQQLQRWDLESGAVESFAGHESWVRAIGFSPDGTTLYTAGYDGQLITWDLTAQPPRIARRIAAHDGWIRWLSVSSHGQLVATGGNDRAVRIWQSNDGTELHELNGHEAHVYSVMFLPGDNELLSGDLLGKVHQWNLTSGQVVRSFDASDLHSYNEGQGAHYGGVRSMSLSPDGRQLACSGLHKATNPFGAVQEPLTVVFSWETAEKLGMLVGDNVPQGIVWRAMYHPSGTLIGASGGGSGGLLIFWHAPGEKPVHQFKLPSTALDMDLHVDGRRVATVHHDQQVRISELAGG
jgi:WD40 repeat protein